MPTPTNPDSDLRRRAAWLLGMVVVVAVLLVVVMTTLLHSDGGGSTGDAALSPNHITATAPPSGSGASSSPDRSASSSPASPSSSPSSSGATTCPGTQTCALGTDVGNAVAAVNAYRQSHGASTVPGSVTEAAKQCALNRGDGCSGGWAETELSTPDGTLAVAKISQFAKLLDPMKAIQVGWAYDPGSKTYYFSTIRTT